MAGVEGDDEDDDYMSAAFLEPAAAPRSDTTRAETYSERRQRQEREQLAKNPRSKQAIKEELAAVEEARRQEGLKRKLDASNKGMQMLMRMGFKAEGGGGLGKRGQGMAAPIDVSLRSGRMGLGLEEEKEREAEDMRKRMKLTEESQRDFRLQMSSRFQDKTYSTHTNHEWIHATPADAHDCFRLKNDVSRCRKMMYEFDTAAAETDLRHYEFWPIRRQPGMEEAAGSDDEEGDEERVVAAPPDDGGVFGGVAVPSVNNADDAPLPPPAWKAASEQFEALEPADQLDRLLDTLRTTYHYCIYCGCKYTTAAELAQNCPGKSRDEH
ncbi:hypothetical protein RI367_001223 [Sorochytrium milnesiophthora]